MPAVVEHQLVAPFVAIFLDQRGEEAQGRVFGMDRRLGIRGFQRLDDGRRILERASSGVMTSGISGSRARASNSSVLRPLQPAVREPLVAEPGPHLDRIGRHLVAEDHEGRCHAGPFVLGIMSLIVQIWAVPRISGTARIPLPLIASPSFGPEPRIKSGRRVKKSFQRGAWSVATRLKDFSASVEMTGGGCEMTGGGRPLHPGWHNR